MHTPKNIANTLSKTKTTWVMIVAIDSVGTCTVGGGVGFSNTTPVVGFSVGGFGGASAFSV
jgi:hypothetical protein